MLNSPVQGNIYKSLSEFAFAGLTTSFKIGCQVASTNLSMASKILETTRHFQEAADRIYSQGDLSDSGKSTDEPSKAEPAKKAKTSKTGMNGKSASDTSPKTLAFPTPFWFFPLTTDSKESEKQAPEKKSETFAFTPFPVSPFLKIFQAPQATDIYSKFTPVSFFETMLAAWTPKQQTPFFAGNPFSAWPNFAGFTQPVFNFDPFKAFLPFQNSPKPAHLFQPHHVLPWAVNLPINTPFSASMAMPFSNLYTYMAPFRYSPASSWPFAQSGQALKGLMMFLGAQR